jgi:hypothetical protein
MIPNRDQSVTTGSITIVQRKFIKGEQIAKHFNHWHESHHISCLRKMA